MRIAAVTMTYNEPDFLPIWLRHYGHAFGAGQCHVIDHGSDDGSTEGAPNRLRLPRSPHDDVRRAALVSRFCAALLSTYDAVLYTDVDELVLHDPLLHASLAEACGAEFGAVSYAAGFNLVHAEGEEPLDAARPIGEQRHWVRFASAMCKPVMLRRPATFAPGFHCCAENDLAFGTLRLLHLRWCDRAIAWRRHQKTRAMAWADPSAGSWQRGSDAAFEALFNAYARLPRCGDRDPRSQREPVRTLLDGLRASDRPGQTYRFPLDIEPLELWPLSLDDTRLF